MKMLFKFSVVLCLAAFALPAWADNAIQMVTYFPVPYAAYNNLYIQNASSENPGKFEIGTSKGEFLLSVGSPDSSQSLSATSVFLREKTALNFTTDLANSVAAKFGNMTEGEDKSDAELTFNKVLINELAKTATAPAKKITATDLKVKGKTYLFEDAFQDAADAALPTCSDTVTWKQLTVNGHKGYYLVCGEAAEPPSGKCKRWELQKATGTVYCYDEHNDSYAQQVWNHSDSPLAALAEGGNAILNDPVVRCHVGSLVWNATEGYWFSPHNASNSTCEAHFVTTSNPPDYVDAVGDYVLCLDVNPGKTAGGYDEQWPLAWPEGSPSPCPPAYENPSTHECTNYSAYNSYMWWSGENGEDPGLTLWKAVCMEVGS